MLEIKSDAKFFKAGNSYGFRVTKHDKEMLHAEPGDTFEKVISPDGQSVTFRKKSTVSPQTMEMIEELFNENHELMERLKNE